MGNQIPFLKYPIHDKVDSYIDRIVIILDNWEPRMIDKPTLNRQKQAKPIIELHKK
jgi:hypothetical protein